jgi:hypothetical protein
MDSKENPDLPATGTIWINADTGQVLRTVIRFELGLDRQAVTTKFTLDPGLEIAVPVEMREVFDVGLNRVSGVATYGRFRSFGVTTDEVVKQ